MNVTVENLAACKRLLRVEVDAAAVDAVFASVTIEFQQRVKLPGFRPGKAPRQLVERTMASRIDDEVRRQLIPDAYRQAVQEQKLRPIAASQVEEVQFGRGQPLQFTVTLEIEPDFTVPDYKGLPVRRENRVVTDDDVRQALNMLRGERATFLDVARPVQSGDYVVVNYTGVCEDKPISDWAPAAGRLTHEENFWMLVQPEAFIPGFTDQLVGAQAGETRAVQVLFPADFVEAALRGKTGNYTVTVVQVKERMIPELDDAFARGFGAPEVGALIAGVRRDLENELKLKQKRDVRDQMLNVLLNRVNFDLPDPLVEQETRNVVFDVVSANQQRGITKEAIDRRKDEIYGFAQRSAKERVKSWLILSRIAEREGISAAEEEITVQVEQLAEKHKARPEKVRKQLEENGGLDQIRQRILTSKVLDFLELQAVVEEAPAAR